jgi:inner membrane protein
MSSIVGHGLAGVAVCLACNRAADRRALWALPAFVFLAVGPDLDYFAIWWWHAQPVLRLTHTLLFAVTTSLLMWGLTASLRMRLPANIPFLALLLASVSHPLLDLLVGAHGLPLLWPFTDRQVALPFGLLPSAGRLALDNYYLWRNLLIELGILVPLFGVLVAIARGTAPRMLARNAAFVLPLWLAMLAWSISLPR